MNSTILTLYILVWPVLSAAVLAALVAGVWRDVRHAKRRGEHLV
jgi:hypothetical protein